MTTLHFELITPEKIAYEDEINQVTVPTVQGEVTILPNHVSLLTQVNHGELIIKKHGKIDYLGVTGGFLEVQNNKVRLLADYAVRSEDVEIEKALEAQKRAEKLLKESSENISQRDFAQAQADLRKSIMELKIAGRRKRTTIPTSHA